MVKYNGKKAFMVLAALAACLLAGCSDDNAAGKEETQHKSTTEAEVTTEETTTAEATEAVTETTTEAMPVKDESAQLAAYKKVLEDALYNRIIPVESAPKAEDSEDLTENMFAIYDVDGDGSRELIYSYTTGCVAAMVEIIFDYDTETAALTRSLEFFPSARFYDNGIMEVDYSHNQGMAGDFWPYTMYQYNSGTDSYDCIGSVDAWDKNLSDTNFFTDEKYPDDIDTSGSGFVYYIYESNPEATPVDVTAYEEWHNSYIGNASLIDLKMLNLTEENINAIK